MSFSCTEIRCYSGTSIKRIQLSVSIQAFSLKWWLLIKPPLMSSVNQHLQSLTHAGFPSSVSHKKCWMDRKGSMILIIFSTCTPAHLLPSNPKISTLYSEQHGSLKPFCISMIRRTQNPAVHSSYPLGARYIKEKTSQRGFYRKCMGAEH